MSVEDRLSHRDTAILGFGYYRKQEGHGQWSSIELLEKLTPKGQPVAPGFSEAQIFRSLAGLVTQALLLNAKKMEKKRDEKPLLGRPSTLYEITESGESALLVVTRLDNLLRQVLMLPESVDAILAAQNLPGDPQQNKD